VLGGCLALMAGAGVTIAAIETGNAAVLLLGTAIAGLGFGPAFAGAYRTVVALAPADDRAGLIAAIFTLSYLSTGLPALIAGITTTQFGLHSAALVYSAAITGLAVAAAGTFLSRHGSRAPATPFRD
jgi:MFS family permease